MSESTQELVAELRVAVAFVARRNRELPEGSESQRLENDPVAFLTSRYDFASAVDGSGGRKELPEYVVMFSPTAKKIDDLLDRGLYIAVRLLRVCCRVL